MNKGTWGKLRAFFDVQTDEGFTMKGFKIVEGINGLFVSPPSQKGKDDEYYDTIFIAPELREELNHTAIQHYGMAEEGNSGGFNDFPASGNNTPEATISKNPDPIRGVEDQSSESATITKPDSQKEEDTTFDDDIPF